MSRCLFCLTESSELTDEHVFPAALGGNLVVERSVCDEDNHGSSKFEQPVVQSLAPLRLLLCIPDRYGRLPEVSVTAEVDGRRLPGLWRRDGRVQLKPAVTVTRRPDGSLQDVLHEHITHRRREELRREAQERGLRFMEVDTSIPPAALISASGDIEFIGSPSALRMATKIAYVGLAHHFGQAFAMRNIFQNVRGYVTIGEGTPAARLFANHSFLATVEHGPHQHSIVIAGRRDKHRVDAIVRLFGSFCYFVTLTEQYEGADIYHTLAYDAYRGEVEGMLMAHAQAEFLWVEDVATSKETVWDDISAAANSFLSFINRQIQSKLDHMRRGEDHAF